MSADSNGGALRFKSQLVEEGGGGFLRTLAFRGKMARLGELGQYQVIKGLTPFFISRSSMK